MKSDNLFKEIKAEDGYDLYMNILDVYDDLLDFRDNNHRCWDKRVEPLSNKQQEHLQIIINQVEELEKILEKYRGY